jgi:hypothetical protein
MPNFFQNLLYRSGLLWYVSLMNDTEWTPTRRGGFRRSHARVAQQMGTPEQPTEQTRAVATADVEARGDTGQYSEEHLRADAHHTEGVGGSNPSPGTKFILKFNEQLGLPTCPYLVRWRFETPWGSIRLHHWIGPDDDRHRHDHPWNFITFVLRGGYTDLSPSGDEHLKAPTVQYRSAEHQHTVVPDEGGAWTIIITGPKIRNWGFWVNGKFRSHIKYFWKFGHHPCN